MKQNQLLAFSSVFLLWFAWPPIPFTGPILLFAFVPLLIAIERIIESDQAKKGKQIFWLCLQTFFLWNVLCTYWIFYSLHAAMSTLFASLFCLVPFGLTASFMVLCYWLYYHLRRVTSKRWSYIGLICFWLSYEYLHQSWDLAFPWLNLGNGFAQSHQLVQWYEYTGIYGGTLWILLSNILIFETYSAFQELKTKKYQTGLLMASVLCTFLPIIISLLMYISYIEKKKPTNVVLVQPNEDPYKKYGLSNSARQIQHLIHLSDSLGQKNTEYFIWPETAIANFINEDHIWTNKHFLVVREFLLKYKHANVISGIESYLLYDDAKTSTAHLDQHLNKYIDHFNSAIQIESSNKVQFHHKSKLVPGVEQVPFATILAFMKPVFANFGGANWWYGTQKKPTVFYSQSGVGAAPVICYESIWGAYVADYVQQGAQFIAIITNDAWWGNTAGKDQHAAYAKLRAIESRRWVARAANTGISAFINQRGDIVQKSKWWVPTALKENINLNSEYTFYVRYRDYIAYAGCFWTGFFAFFLLIKAFRKKTIN